MSSVENLYIKACIDTLVSAQRPIGDVLQIGFGNGIAAGLLQTYKPRSHTVIELHEKKAARALVWGAEFPNVRIIRDRGTALGVFDAIYAVESDMEKMQQEPGFASRFCKKIGKTLSLRSKKYAQQDIDFFIQKIEKKDSEDKKNLLNFFADLYARGQISEGQWDRVCETVINRGWASLEDTQNIRYVTRRQLESSKEFLHSLQRFIEKHMKKGGRFSCHLEHHVSKYEDAGFLEKIILNSCVDYEETWLDTSEKEAFYRQLLVMRITKQA